MFFFTAAVVGGPPAGTHPAEIEDGKRWGGPAVLHHCLAHSFQHLALGHPPTALTP